MGHLDGEKRFPQASTLMDMPVSPEHTEGSANGTTLPCDVCRARVSAVSDDVQQFFALIGWFLPSVVQESAAQHIGSIQGQLDQLAADANSRCNMLCRARLEDIRRRATLSV